MEGLFDQRAVSLSFCLVGMILFSYLFIRLTAPSVFSTLADPEIKKADLFIYPLLPLCFTFELSYQLEPLLRRAGLIIPVLGRQLGFNWDTLGIHAASGSVTVFQVLTILAGLIASRVVLNKVRQNYEAHHTNPTTLRRSWPLVLLATVYIYFFIVS